MGTHTEDQLREHIKTLGKELRSERKENLALIHQIGRLCTILETNGIPMPGEGRKGCCRKITLVPGYTGKFKRK